MAKFKRLFKEPAFHLVLLICYMFQFGWPFLTVPENSHVHGVYVGLFGSWFSFIILLFLISRAE